MPGNRAYQALSGGLLAGLALLGAAPAALAAADLRDPAALARLSLEELLQVEVYSVSRREEKLAHAASAIQVIGREEIRRSGASTLTEALRLAPNLQVAQQSAYAWAISARGFNGAPLANSSLANKLLVLIDGRTVYTPLFGGVFWDVQHVLLEDVERIEVISGPGGALWGSNAVNGVINVVSRDARDSAAGHLSASVGAEQRSLAVRHGATLGEDGAFRVYLQRHDRDPSLGPSGSRSDDAWQLAQFGFRADFGSDAGNGFTVQGDHYEGRQGAFALNELDGQNLLARWTRTPSNASQLVLQAYVDRTWRQLNSGNFDDELLTFDLDLQHRLQLGARHTLLWGGGYRHIDDRANNSPQLSFAPARARLQLFSLFVQDEIELAPQRLRLTLGTKLEHNDYSGLEVQPSVRLAWTPGAVHTGWLALSRAVHAPSRFDADLLLPLGSDPDFSAERVLAWEAGWRATFEDRLALSLALFRHDYDDLRSIDVAPFRFANSQAARSHGAELSGEWRATDGWRLRGGATFLDTDIRATRAGVVPGSDRLEAVDPRRQFLLQSILDLPAGFQLDTVARYAGALPASPIVNAPAIDSRLALDLRLAWQSDTLELALVGRNLLDRRAAEFGSPGGAMALPRSVFGRISWRF